MLLSLRRRELSVGVRQCEQGSKSRSGAESPKAVSGYGLPRYHGKRFVRTSQSGFAHANQAGWYRESFVPDANGIRAFLMNNE